MNGEYLLGGGRGGVQEWRVKDGKRTASMKTSHPVFRLAVSKDGKWIAGGTNKGEMHVWDAETHELVLSHKEFDDRVVTGLDFSPDSTRLVAALDKTATIWDLGTRKQVQILTHHRLVYAGKYSLQGDRIATATADCVRVWDSCDGRLLTDIKITVISNYDTGLLWAHNHLLVITDNKITQIEASVGALVSHWPVPDTNYLSCIAVPKHQEFIIYSSKRIVSFWDAVTHTQLGLIRQPGRILSTAVSPDDSLIAIGGEQGKMSVHKLSCINVSSMSRSCLSTTFIPSGRYSFIKRIFLIAPHIPGTRHSD